MKLIRLLCLASLAALVACGGGSAPTSQAPPATLPVPTKVVPIKVLATSYENKNDILLDDTKLPHLSDIPGVIKEAGEQDIGERALAFADFMQEGTFSAITATTFYKNVFPGSNPGHWPDAPSKLYFLRKNAAGTWTDVTPQLIKTPAE